MSNMNNRILHSGIIDAITEKCVRVRILQTSACAQCKISGHCNSAESKEKIVDVYNVRDKYAFKIGEEVIVCASLKIVSNAMLLGFGLPLALILIILISVYMSTTNEAHAALCGIGSLLPYYVILYFFRNSIRDRIAFGIEKKI